MKTKFLLPYKFKKWGSYMAPLGFIGWAWVQKNSILVDERWIITGFLFITFCSFLIGMAFLIFSREKTEDEYTQKVRLESYQFAAILQFSILFLLTVLVMIFSESRIGVIVFEQLPIFFILLFWFIFFIRFNYILHFSKSEVEKEL